MTYTAADFATLQAEKNAAVAAQALANGARFALEQEVAELRAEVEFLTIQNNQFINGLDQASAAPTPAGEPDHGQPSDMSAAREPSPITS